MNERTAGAVLLVIGAVAVFAAIVGGGIKIQQIEVGSVQSKWRQWLLAAFGLVIAMVGLVLAIGDDNSSDSAAATENAAVVDANAADANAAEPATDVDTNAPDENVGDANGGDENSSEADDANAQ
jgi:hypothetical protein